METTNTTEVTLPFSYDFFNEATRQFIVNQDPQPQRILDIGPGAGKHGKIFRADMPNATIDAAEIHEPYITEFDLPATYNHIMVADVTALVPAVLNSYDLIVMGDVLEHLTVEQAQAVLSRIGADTAILILVPYNYPQGPCNNNPHEAHEQSDLTEAIFRERYYQFGLKKIFGNHQQGVFYRSKYRADLGWGWTHG